MAYAVELVEIMRSDFGGCDVNRSDLSGLYMDYAVLDLQDTLDLKKTVARDD
jgi:hypothetical protein